MSVRILIVDDEANMRKILEAMMRREGYKPYSAENGRVALQLLAVHPDTSAIITDLRMPDMDGLQLLDECSRNHPHIPVIMITAHGTVDTAVQAMKQGAFDYVTKPFEQTELTMVVKKAVRSHLLSREHMTIEAGEGESGDRYRMIGTSERIRDVYRIIEKVADSPSTVLIRGESGTGKELIANAIHAESSRRDMPFVKLNCAAIPETLLESELFGYEKGAFTGAVTSKPGRFELADKGSLFLDEVGDIPKEMQVKLLRVLQEQEFERVGGIKTINVDVRLITATNHDLEADVAAGSFRQDLYYRLNIIPIELPALRNRSGDIPLLINYFISKFNRRLQRNIRGLSEQAMSLLLTYSWPGNIRELENVLERAILLSDADILDIADFPSNLRSLTPRIPVPVDLPEGISLKDLVREQTAELEREIIRRALQETDGNVTRAARRLKISRKSLQLKMKDFGLRRDRPE